jgi:hypothetical protein
MTAPLFPPAESDGPEILDVITLVNGQSERFYPLVIDTTAAPLSRGVVCA